MDNPRPITHEQFKDAARRLLLKKPGPDAVSDNYEPTEEELEQVVRVGPHRPNRASNFGTVTVTNETEILFCIGSETYGTP